MIHPSDYKGVVGTSVVITCNVTDLGNPPAVEFKWVTNKGRIIGTSTTPELIFNVTAVEKITYTCYAKNDIGLSPNADYAILTGLSKYMYNRNTFYYQLPFSV